MIARYVDGSRARVISFARGGLRTAATSVAEHTRSFFSRLFLRALPAVAVAGLALSAQAADYTTITSEDAVAMKGASGGDIVRRIDNGDHTFDLIHIFTNTTSSATFSLENDKYVVEDTLRLLAVGGGGGGGGDCGGGGGGGGLVYLENQTLAVGSWSIKVGAGGVSTVNNTVGVPGSSTAITNIDTSACIALALGGGGGGRWSEYNASRMSGGSGGGCGGNNSTIAPALQATEGYPAGGYGNTGANRVTDANGGGGGGAGGVGSSTNDGAGHLGDGGPGLQYDITGENQFYAAGGGGGGTGGYGTGGSGVGGNGSQGSNSGTRGNPGKNGTGSGGGGGPGGGNNNNRYGGAGGSGIVVVRYTVTEKEKTVINGRIVESYGAEITENQGEYIFKFTDPTKDNAFILPGAMKAWILAVGGGGAGASPYTASTGGGGAGGGGAGGFLEVTNMLSGGVYSINVGAGGAGGTGSETARTPGNDGNDTYLELNGTVIDSLRAYGGGGGGIWSVGRNGGSGGGGSCDANTQQGGNASQGYPGGVGYKRVSATLDGRQSGAGGGGAGGPGANAITNNVGAAGGIGKASWITGAEVFYAGGGGGGSRGHSTAESTGGEGGKGGGGHGGYGSSSNKSPAGGGTDGLGGGGGGGCYNLPGGKGGNGVVIIRILKVMPDKPHEVDPIPYDGMEHVIFPENEAYTITGTARATDVNANYSFTATPNAGYCWSDGTTAAVTINWKITPAEIALKEFFQQGWQIGEARPETVLIVTNIVTGAAVELTEAEVNYTYATTEAGPYTARTLEQLEAAGDSTWYMKAEVLETVNHSALATGTISFNVWKKTEISGDVVGTLAYHADFTVTKYDRSELTDFPMVIRISDNSPENFEYPQAASDGSDIRFIDENGEFLPFELDTWNTSGESVFWVKVPKYRQGTKVTMCWGLVDGKTPPEAPEESVWSSYTAVWHMSETITAANAATTDSADSSGNGYSAKPTNGGNGNLAEMVSAGGVFGNSRVNASDYHNDTMSLGNRLAVTASSSLSLGSTFTFSGWYKFDNFYGTMPCLVSRKSAALGTGWEAKVWGTGSGRRAIAVYGGGGTTERTEISDQALNNNDYYTYVTLVYDGTTVTIYADGDQANSFTIEQATDNDIPLAFGGCQYDGTTVSLWGKYDELRIRRGALSADWIYADYLQGADPKSVTVSPTMYDGESTLINKWVVEPAEFPTTWTVGQNPEITDYGTPLYGESFFILRTMGGDVIGTNTTDTVKAGTFIIDFVVPAGKEERGGFAWTGLSYPVAVIVAGDSPTGDLSGTAGSSTLSGRVLLANDDTTMEITGQAYNYTDSSGETYWVHEDDTAPLATLFPNIKSGANHKFYSKKRIGELCGVTNIWKLTDVYIGTPYNASAAIGVVQNRNILPYSSSSSSSDAGASYLIMRNVTNATVTSACYTNGIGTIYFDAVNGSKVGAGTDYNFTVEVVRGDAAMAETIAESAWERVDVVRLKREASEATTFNRLSVTNEVALDITGGNYGKDSFYRIYVPFNDEINGVCHEPIRFRIRRLTIPDDTRFMLDRGGFILLDNIVVSYPAMRADLENYGVFDKAKAGKQTLGSELAWDVPFPSVNDTVYARATADFYTNPGNTNADVNAFITSAKMYYRWRYLEQNVGDWLSISLDPSQLSPENRHLGTEFPLDLTNGTGSVLPGDVEFFYELQLNCPYYKFVDYAAVSDFKMTDFYTEKISVVTNSQSIASGSDNILESRGTDWFVRLREGQSDYEAIKVEYFRAKAGETPVEYFVTNDTPYITTIYREKLVTQEVASVNMEVVGNRSWRGYIQTLDPTNLYFRVHGINKQTPGSRTFELNDAYWSLDEAATNVWPISSTMVESDENGWFSIWADAKTGYLMYQLAESADDDSRSLTIVHADYQNVNAWNDAKSEKFRGNSTEDTKKTGTSPRSLKVSEDFNDWGEMEETTSLWQESFTLDSGSLEKPVYTSFQSSTTPNGWMAGQGMFVLGRYKDYYSKVGYALQMEGQGRGYLDFIDAAYSPRGLKSVAFSARLGQFIEFGDFAYYMGDNFNTMSNYTFQTRVNFDFNSCKNFRGNASLSMVAYYRPGIGCYEYRIEPLLAKRTNNNVADGWDHRTMIFSLHRWRYTNGRMIDYTLGAITNGYANVNGSVNLGEDIKWPDSTSQTTGNYVPMYISVSNDVVNNVTCVMAGIKRSSTVKYSGQDKGGNYFSIAYRDQGNSSGTRLTRGSYGCLSANCEGVFQRPSVWAGCVPFVTAITTVNRIEKWSNNAVTYNGTENICKTGLEENVEDGDWYFNQGRMKAYKSTVNTETELFGLKYVAEPQSVTINTAPAGTSKWTPIGKVTVTGFGSASSQVKQTVTPYLTDDCSVRISVDGDASDTRRDVVIDDLEVVQWRGADITDRGIPGLVPGLDVAQDVQSNSGHKKIIFTTAWIKGGDLLLSARRTATNAVASVTGPLFDGLDGRGDGLGMFSFGFKNAQTNACLCLQICTNYSGVGTFSADLRGGTWETIEKFQFTPTTPDRASGTRSTYIGLHGVNGRMRLIVDPDLVASLKRRNVQDLTAFGDITITRVDVRDEPELDEASWWGWNLRSVGATGGVDTEERMYLPDMVTSDGDLAGLSLGLNNSTSADTDDMDAATYAVNYPFVQSPTFGTNLVGEVMFRARKYDAGSSKAGVVSLFGSVNPTDEGTWKWLQDFEVADATYRTFSFKTNPSDDYKAFRIAVMGVEGVTSPMTGKPGYTYTSPTRVLLDELLVSEAVRARVGFRRVGAFRGDMDLTTIVPGAHTESQQPLCGEDFGIQCEIYKAQLPEEIDFVTRPPMVRMHWFEGENPWGYANWKDDANAKHGWLTLASDADPSNMVFRTVYPNKENEVISPLQPTAPGTVVQYMLEVLYCQTNSTVYVTNRLEQSDWPNPAWYHPVDKNTDAKAFSAYTILDSVAPHWAWINEVNVFGKWISWQNNEKDLQYVEIAAPAEADLSRWRLESVEIDNMEGTMFTNRLATFGRDGLEAKKPNLVGMASNMVFRVIGSPKSQAGGKLKKSDGTLDGTWKVEGQTSALALDGTVDDITPIGFRLVRGSGIIEHEIVTIGTNYYTAPYLVEAYHPTNTVNALKRVTGEDYLYPGPDSGGEPNSLSVTNGNGLAGADWSNRIVKTPGRINEGQYIDPRHPTPNGSSVIVYANLDQTEGRIWQTVGRAVHTNLNQIIYIQKGDEFGTNITYYVEPWFEMGSVTTNGAPADWSETAEPRVYVATVGVNASNNVTVVASPKLREDIDAKIDDADYREAIKDWLRRRTYMDGSPWDDQEGDDVYLADIQRHNPEHTVVTNMSLTEMYWLDMNPTVSNQALEADVTMFSTKTRTYGDEDGWTREEPMDNVRMTVFMAITNRTTGEAYAPYVIRGREPGSSSWEYENNARWAWSNATFKVEGFLMNGRTIYTDDKCWVPLRWFVFHGDVFNSSSFNDDFITEIELYDPYSKRSTGYPAGWYDWALEHGKSPIYFRWNLNTKLTPIGAQVMCPTNWYIQ